MRLKIFAAVAASSLSLCCLSGTASAAARHPDLSGYWSTNTPPSIEDPALKAKLSPNAVILHDTGAPELQPGDFGGLKLKPEVAAAAAKWDPRSDFTLDKACLAPSIIYAMQGPFPLEIFQDEHLIVIKLEYFEMTRIVHMDGKHPPADAPHTKTGHSTGRWEGDTLVVDTTHLSGATITNNGLYHSDNVHVIERFKLSPDGKKLISSQEFEDPETIDNRGARFIAWQKQDGQYLNAYECDPTFALNYGAK